MRLSDLIGDFDDDERLGDNLDVMVFLRSIIEELSCLTERRFKDWFMWSDSPDDTVIPLATCDSIPTVL